jgi:hypothetical protein
MRAEILTVAIFKGSAEGLEELYQVGESCQFQKSLAGRGMVDGFVLEDPGEVVRDKDGVQAGGEGGVDVGLRAVSDHPRRTGFAAVMFREAAVGSMVFLRENFDSAEVRGEAGAAQLVRLLGVIAFGDQDEAMAGGEVGQGVFNAGEQFDLLGGDGLGEADDAFVLVRRDGDARELLEAVDEGLAETSETVAAGDDGGVLAAVEMFADLLGSVDAVVEIRNEGRDGALEVDVVLPERVVSVDEQGLVGRVPDGIAGGAHSMIIRLSLAVAILRGAMTRLGDVLCSKRVKDWSLAIL